jgi:hypothetical protein
VSGLNTKLIIVEGIPGSGKSTTAQYIKKLLDEKGCSVKLFREGDTEHPADYESTACLTEDQFLENLKKYPEDQALIKQYTEKKGGLYFVHYYDLFYENQSKEAIANEFGPFDVYELDLDLFEQVALDYWKEFVANAVKEDAVYIFECCFLQNPFTKFIAKHNANISRLNDFMSKLSSIVKPLNPTVFYYYQDDVPRSFRTTFEKRSEAWRQFFTDYHVNNGYGKEQSLEGFGGLVEYLEMRRDEELKLINNLEVNSCTISNDEQNWDKYYDFIKRTII